MEGTPPYAPSPPWQVHSSFWLAVPFAVEALRTKVAGPRKVAEPYEGLHTLHLCELHASHTFHLHEFHALHELHALHATYGT